MISLKLIYFNNCPNATKAIELLKKTNLEFEMICQDDLSNCNPLQSYSSPTLLVNDKIVFGSVAQGGGCSLNLPTLLELTQAIEKEISKKKILTQDGKK